MNFLHVRHATSLLTYGGLKILVDPVFAEKGLYPPIDNTPNQRPNPLVNLSTPLDTLLDSDAILCTHTHDDHFDKIALQLIDKNTPIICQSEDENHFISNKFNNVFPVKKSIIYKNIHIERVNAQHGDLKTSAMLGSTSGYILSAKDEPKIYFLGDTIFTDEVKNNILQYKPDILVINAGSPKFLDSSPLVMDIYDIEKTIKINTNLQFVIVHLDTFNHCIETREIIKEYFNSKKLKELNIDNFLIPDDNETIYFK